MKRLTDAHGVSLWQGSCTSEFAMNTTAHSLTQQDYDAPPGAATTVRYLCADCAAVAAADCGR